MYIATCVDGMEEICEREVDGRKAWKGRVEFEGEVKKFNSVKNIYDLWKGFKFSSQKDIIAQAKTINNEIAGTFKVVANREGEHNFSSMEIERSVGEVFHEKGFKVDLKKPRSIVFVDIKDEMCFIGLLKEFELNKRKYRFKRITPNLDCTIAYGMMKLADIKDDEIIFNPHCKDGVIAVEAALNSRGRIYCDDNSNNMRNADINIRLAEADVKYGKPEKIDKVLAILPSYIRRLNNGAVDRILDEFFEEFKDVKRMVAVCSMDIESFTKGFKTNKKLELSAGDSKYFIFVLEKTI